MSAPARSSRFASCRGQAGRARPGHHQSPRLEDPELLKRRIDEAAQHVALDQLCLSGQCGFSSTQEGNRLTIDEQKRKLELIVSVAEDVWGR